MCFEKSRRSRVAAGRFLEMTNPYREHNAAVRRDYAVEEFVTGKPTPIRRKQRGIFMNWAGAAITLIASIAIFSLLIRAIKAWGSH